MSVVVLHPAERRRLIAGMPTVPMHQVELRPLGGGDGRTMIVSADEQDFIEAVLSDVTDPHSHQKLAARRGKRRGEHGVLELSQPVHRRFHLVLLEANCHEPGRPRLDPRKIAGMGLVVRRQVSGRWQGWMRDGTKRLGWEILASADRDPEVAGPDERTGAGPHIGALLAARLGHHHAREEVHPLFVAPEDMCQKAGKTILYGLIPVASGERSDKPTPAQDYHQLPKADLDELKKHFSAYLSDRPPTGMPSADIIPAVGEVLPPAKSLLQSADPRQMLLGKFLQQMLVELDALGTNAAARELMAAFATIRLPLTRATPSQPARTVSAADFIRQAAPIFIAGEPNRVNLKMPLEWPRVSAALGARLSNLAITCLSRRAAQISPPTPKFDGDTRLYAVRAFIRAETHEGCPPKMVWTPQYSESFRVLPWWDGDGPATKITMPRLSDFKRMKPNVSFQLPPELAGLLQGDMKKLKDGEKSGGGGLDIFWLCSFSIPIITLCAFIVLNIFLSLFDLIFSWLAFIKICIPIPRPK